MQAYRAAIVAGAFAVYALVSRRLRGSPVTGPMLSVAFGLLIGTNGLGLVHPGTDPHLFTLTFEATLVLVLFTDAMGLKTGSWRTEVGLPARLLGIGLPLTIAVGWGLAAWMFGKLDIWEAAEREPVGVRVPAADVGDPFLHPARLRHHAPPRGFRSRFRPSSAARWRSRPSGPARGALRLRRRLS